MKSIIFRGLLLIGVVWLLAESSFAQTDRELLAELVAEEQEAVNALVLYPDDTRQSILVSTQYPEALIKISSIQSRTSNAFQDLMESYPSEVQKMIWDLTRYPGLVDHLALADLTFVLEHDDALEDFPEVIHARAREAIRNHQTLLIKVRDLQLAADQAFDALLVNYPLPAQQSLRQLIGLPEVMTILTENIRLTVLVGDLYQRDPDWLLHKVDSLNLEVARQQAEELNDWRELVESDPTALDDYAAAGDEFAEAFNYDDEYYDWDEYAGEYEENRTIRVSHHYYHHYPYWFGYPYWYGYPCWRPYPYWYDWGFHHHHRHGIVVIGLPSIRFTHWYFHHGHHHHWWPALSTSFVRHYHRHPRRHGSVTIGVRTWQTRNETIISNAWLQDDGQLRQRFVEFGKFESNRTKYNTRNPDRAMSQKEFVVKHTGKYPTLSKSQREITQQKVAETQKSRLKPTPQVRKPEKIPTQATKKPTNKYTPRSVPRVKEGRDYHRDKWERAKPAESKARRAAPQKKIKPKATPKSPRKTVKPRAAPKTPKKVGPAKGTPKPKPKPKKKN